MESTPYPDPPPVSGVAEPAKIIELEDLSEAKGQEVSEGNCGVLNFSKNQRKSFLNFFPSIKKVVE